MMAALAAAGFGPTDSAADADLIVVNTCGFIQPAKEESIQTTLELRRENPRARLIVAGCLTQRYEDQLRKELPEIDGFVGTGIRPRGIPCAALLSSKREQPAGRLSGHPALPRRTRLLSLPGPCTSG